MIPELAYIYSCEAPKTADKFSSYSVGQPGWETVFQSLKIVELLNLFFSDASKNAAKEERGLWQRYASTINGLQSINRRSLIWSIRSPSLLVWPIRRKIVKYVLLPILVSSMCQPLWLNAHESTSIKPYQKQLRNIFPFSVDHSVDPLTCQIQKKRGCDSRVDAENRLLDTWKHRLYFYWQCKFAYHVWSSSIHRWNN